MFWRACLHGSGQLYRNEKTRQGALTATAMYSDLGVCSPLLAATRAISGFSLLSDNYDPHTTQWSGKTELTSETALQREASFVWGGVGTDPAGLMWIALSAFCFWGFSREFT